MFHYVVIQEIEDTEIPAKYFASKDEALAYAESVCNGPKQIGTVVYKLDKSLTIPTVPLKDSLIFYRYNEE